MASKTITSSTYATAVKPPATDPAYQERKPSRDIDAELAAGLSAKHRQAAAAADELAPLGAAVAGESPAAGGETRGTAAPRGSSSSSRRVAVILHGKRADEADVRAAVKALRLEGVKLDVKASVGWRRRGWAQTSRAQG